MLKINGDFFFVSHVENFFFFLLFLTQKRFCIGLQPVNNFVIVLGEH